MKKIILLLLFISNVGLAQEVVKVMFDGEISKGIHMKTIRHSHADFKSNIIYHIDTHTITGTNSKNLEKVKDLIVSTTKDEQIQYAKKSVCRDTKMVEALNKYHIVLKLKEITKILNETIVYEYTLNSCN